MELILKSEHPERWQEPCIFAVLSSAQESLLIASGYFSQLLHWEQRFPGQSVSRKHSGLEFELAGDGILLDTPAKLTSIFIEIVTDSTGKLGNVEPFLRSLLPASFLEEILNLPHREEITIDANRDTEVPNTLTRFNTRFIDVPVNTLPSTRNKEPLISATRWARVIVWNNGAIIIWSPPVGFWASGHVRWPHNAIPSKTELALRELLNPTLNPASRVRVWFNELMNHEKYYLESWLRELGAWESRIYTKLARGEKAYEVNDLPVLQSELAILADYLDRVRVSERFYLRRAKVSKLIQSIPGLADEFIDTESTLKQNLEDARKSLRSAFDLLGTVAQGVNANLAQKTQQNQDRLHLMIELVTAVLVVPSLVAAIYGTNIRELAPDSLGSIGELIALIISLSIISFGVLAWVKDGKPTLNRAWVVILGSTIFLVAVLRHISWLLSFISIGVGILAIIGIQIYLSRKPITYPIRIKGRLRNK